MGQVSPIENNLPGFSHVLTSSTSRLLRYPFMCSWASLVAQLVKNLPAMQETWVQYPWRRAKLPTSVFWPGEFHGLYSQSHTQLSNFYFTS